MITYKTLEDGSLQTNNTTIPTTHRFYQDAFDQVADPEIEAEIIPYTVPVPTTAEKIAAIRDAIGLHIETVAKSAGDFGFDSVLTAVSYRGGEPSDINSIYSAAVFDYRNACYVKSRELFTEWQTDGVEITPDEAVAAMPLWSNYNPEV